MQEHGPLEVVLSPAAGGGWEPWGQALQRFVGRIAGGPVYAVVITQSAFTHRYAQFMVGYDIAFLELGSNRFLEPAEQFSETEQQVIEAIGWSPPDDDQRSGNPNYSLGPLRAHSVDLAERIATAVVEVLGFHPDLPVELNAFLAERPCQTCAWPDPIAG